MKSIDSMVEEFTVKFNAHEQTLDTRFMFLREEFKETQKAYLDNDMFELVDGLADIIYVATGMLHKIGIKAEDAVQAVHNSNMSKTPASNSGEKVMKGPNYFAPTDSIKKLLEHTNV